MAERLHGVIPALVTPRDDARDDVDLERLKTLVHWLLEQGVHGLFPTSSTGEAPLLSWKQRQKAVATVAEAVQGRVPVIAGAGAASTAESIRLARDAQAAGATHLCVLPLHFAPLTPDELYVYFAAVADSVNIPTLLYNYPARTSGQNIPADVAANLAAGHHVVGLKDSSGDLANSLSYLAACPPDFALFIGSEALVYPALAMGGAGTICAGANVFPKQLIAIYEAFQTRDGIRARQCQEKMLPWRKLVTHGTFPAAVKYAMQQVGQPVGCPFLPVQPLTAKQQASITSLVRQIAGEDA